MSVQKAIEIIQSIYEIEATTTKSKEKVRHLLLLTEEHKLLAALFQFGC